MSRKPCTSSKTVNGDDLAVDIVVPVWNRPVETRNCLVGLIDYSSSARLILVDNGSDRETEIMLQEFADGLGERALLLRNDVNQGYVKAVNQGLARSNAPYAAVIRNTTEVTAGWLEPLLSLALERSDAGLVIPYLYEVGNKQRGRKAGAVVEGVSVGTFAAMLLNKRMYDKIGGFDEELDGGGWCLRDYSRRAYQSGFLSYAVADSSVWFRPEIRLGSLTRREETDRRSAEVCASRWGKEGAFCLYFPKAVELPIVEEKLRLLMTGACHGHRFHLLLPGPVYRQLLRRPGTYGHSNISLEALPLWNSARGAEKAFSRFQQEMPAALPVSAIDGMPFPGNLKNIYFAELDRLISEAERSIYGRTASLTEG